MKIRTDFVTNSSSSSFIINKSKLTKEQIQIIFNDELTLTKAEELGMCQCGDPYEWNIQELEDRVIGYTDMDNFDYIKFLRKIGVNINNGEYSAPGAGYLGMDWLYKKIPWLKKCHQKIHERQDEDED